MDILNRLKKKEDLSEIFSPENYVFKRSELEKTFLKDKKNYPITKSQLRKYFNTFKGVDNNIKTNPDMPKEEMRNHLKKMMVIYPIMRSKGTFGNNLLAVIEETLRILYDTNEKDPEKAKAWFQNFVEFYETLIAYSRDK